MRERYAHPEASRHENANPPRFQIVVGIPTGMRLTQLRELLEMSGVRVWTMRGEGNGNVEIVHKVAVQLTQAETKVLKAFTFCDNNEEIANLLGVSVSTIRSHVKRLFRKLNVRSRGFAIGRALRLGIVSVRDIVPLPTNTKGGGK